MTATLQQITPMLVALGIGLLIGAERERRKGEGADRGAAGVRTFTITALLGAIAIEAGGDILLGVAMAGLVLLVAIAYWRAPGGDPGLTTEVALLATLALGALAVRQPAMAAGLAVTITVLLAARAPMHRFVTRTLTEAELRSALILAAATLVVWPVLPDRHLGPLDAVNPRSIWSIVVLVMAIGAAGHVAVRALGPGYGLPLSGLASGFVSSSATIAAMGAKAAGEPRLLAPAAAAAVLSTVATVVQTAVLLAAISPSLLSALWLPLALAGAAALTYGVAFAVTATGADTAPVPSGDAFSVRGALFFAGLVAAVLLVSAAARAALGDRGVAVAAGLAGFADVHAAVVSVGSLVAAGKLGSEAAALPLLIGFTTNSLTKIAMAHASGSTPFVARVVPGVLLVLAALWGGWMLA